MNKSTFEAIPCGQTLPPNNIHAVSVSMPSLQDIIDYEEQTPQILEKIKSAYPRFVLHPYLKLLAQFIQKKYAISDSYEVVLLSSQNAVNIVSNKYFIHNKIEIDEPFGVILVLRHTSQLQKVLTFIQHVGCNLSSRFAQDYLYKENIINTLHKEELEDKNSAYNTILQTLGKAYKQPCKNICLAPSGMNAIFSIIRGLKAIQKCNNRTILVQFGWLYLDTMNIVEHHYDETKIFSNISNINLLEEYLEDNGFKVSAIITEVPTNPLLQCVDLPRLKNLCDKYNIPLVIDSTLATPYNLDLEPYADIFVESLTKYACGNADVLMGAFILSENSKLSYMKGEFFKHADMPYIKDLQRLAYEIKDYENRVKKVALNTKKLISFFENCSYVKDVFHCMSDKNEENYKKLMKTQNSYTGIISITFNKPFKEVYDKLNFAKGPSLGTEFTLLMPYVYLAHYDYILTKKGRDFLEKINLPVDLLRISVGIENIDDIINEFKKLEN